MKNAAQDRIVGLILLGLFTAFSVWMWLPGQTQIAPVSSNTTSDLAARLEANQTQLAELIAITNDRPLFDATRQAQAAPEQAAPVAPPEPVLSLVGILGVDDERVALVRVSTSAQLYRLAVGASLGPWQVLEMTTNSITVSKDGGAPDLLRIDR